MAPLQDGERMETSIIHDDGAKVLAPNSESADNASPAAQGTLVATFEEALSKIETQNAEISSLKNELLEIRLAVKALASLNVALENKNIALNEEVETFKRRQERRRRHRESKRAALGTSMDESVAGESVYTKIGDESTVGAHP
eukprot:Nitzschia sp. Nitz4//scaffold11_size288233//276996//277424//NITZ4_000825-RA/size288233-processed-gene-0.193-mRNA-1//1//CDS//3329534227//3949//frame0